VGRSCLICGEDVGYEKFWCLLIREGRDVLYMYLHMECFKKEISNHLTMKIVVEQL